ncbi:diacylglycerol O-acyltransferase 2D-like [Wolffia australiana]
MVRKSGEERVVVKADGSSAILTLLATMMWVCPIAINAFLCVFSLYSRSMTSLWIIGFLILLAFWPVSDKSKYGTAVGRFVGRYSPGYFHANVHFEDARAFDDSRSYVIAAEPHSIFPVGAVCLQNICGLMPLTKTKVLASTAMFCAPILRQVMTWMGVVPASRKNFVNYLKEGYSIIVIPGGVQEIIYMKKGYEVAYLKKRQGFVRIAIETGSPLVPVFCFGQTKAFNWWKPRGQLYARLSRALRFPPLLFWGVFGTPIPHRSQIHIVVGKPIEVKQNPNPTAEEVARVHSQFIADVDALFSKYREITGYPETEFKIL